MRQPNAYMQVVAAINAENEAGVRHTLMMLASGKVVARRIDGYPEALGPRIYLRKNIPPEFRDYDTLLYIAEQKGFQV